MPEHNIADLKLRFLGSLVEQLGAQMYPSVTSTIAELISNAWDADAKNVWVTIPFGQLREPGSEIIVVDDGIGMTHEEARKQYLNVGRKRRVELDSDKTPRGRLLHGRKGIGKLAAFGTAKVLECHTITSSGQIRFKLNYDRIRQTEPGSDYQVEPPEILDPITDPEGRYLEHGTRIVLSCLKLKRNIGEEMFRRSMSRRFALDTSEMKIHLNDSQIERFDYKVEFKFPRDAVRNGVTVAEDGWAEEKVYSEGVSPQSVRWWIGFTEKPLRDQSLQGISVLARGKQVHSPFLFQRSQGVEGQLGQEYLIGEVQADWLDEGKDIDQDLIQANRDQLQLEDSKLDGFMEWGRNLLRWALQTRNSLRKGKIEVDLNELLSEGLLDQLSPPEQKRIRNVVTAISKIPELDIIEGRRLVQSVADAHGDSIIRGLLEDIDSQEPNFQTKLWDIIGQFGLIDARRNQTIIEARLKAIEELYRFIHGGAREVPTIHKHIKDNPWLIDPRWNMFGNEIDLRTFGIVPEPDESGSRVDFLFALGPSQPDTHDELLLVEIKRATHKAGKRHAVSGDEIDRFHRYALKMRRTQRNNSSPYLLTALMIAQEYTNEAQEVKESLETVKGMNLIFRTWDHVLLETERLHKGWLAVTTRRAMIREEDS